MITHSALLNTDCRPQSEDDSIAISVNSLHKQFRLYNSPLERLRESINPFGRTYHRNFAALNDVNFEIKKGETVGIIGRNGSGKSTLMKCITGVLTPTSGTILVNGKISALLELGAGFNPQLTGIENVYFNGTLLGYTKKEMNAKLDDILSFADIGDFVHQPVQTYSSGMFVRLAFAVAIHVDPDILIIDEALAVGDALIQKKCMDKIHDFKDSGKTILMVSHALESVKSFAERGIVMNMGNIYFDGSCEQAITKYLKLLFPPKTPQRSTPTSSLADKNVTTTESGLPILEVFPTSADLDNAFGFGGASISKISIFDLTAPNIFHGNDLLRICISYSWDPDFLMRLVQEHELDSNILFGMSFETVKGITICGFSTSFADSDKADVNPSSSHECQFEFKVNLPELARGDYFMTLGVSLGRQQKHIPLRRYRNLIQLKCISRQENIHGLIAFPLVITKIS